MLYLSIDGGGTKLQIVAFDEHYRLLAKVRGPAVTTNFIPRSEVYKTTRETFERLRDVLPADVEKINGVPVVDVMYRCSVDSEVLPEKILSELMTVRKIVIFSEPSANLLASLLKLTGLLTISGTGSNHIYIVNGEEQRFIGAYGAILGDEGSGYDLGRQALLAAIRADEGRGPETSLRDAIFREYGLIKEMFELTYIVYGAVDSRKEVARATYVLGREARAGDPVAVRILEEGGAVLGRDAATLLKSLGMPHDTRLSATVSGGAWKIHPLLWQTYRRTLLAEFPALDLHVPVFDPAMFGVISTVLNREGNISPERLAELKTEFADFLTETYFTE